MKRLLAIFCLILSIEADAAPLTNAQTYGQQHIDAFRNGTPGMIMAKGTSDNNSYMIEVDPTTGALPVSVTSAPGGNASVSTTGTPVPGSATYVGFKDNGGNLSSVTLTAGGALPVSGSFSLSNDTNYGTVGANTLRTASQIGNATGAADFGAGNSSAQTVRTVIATNQSAIPVSESGTWTVQPGNTANTTPWLMTISQGGNSATVTGANALKVDGSAVTQPVSAASLPLPTGASTSALQTQISGQLPTTLGQKTSANSLAVVIASDQSAVPVTTTSTVTSGTFQDGSIAFGALTTSYQTVVTTGGVAKIVQIRNNTNATVVVSLNGGSTTSYTLDQGDFVALDLATNGSSIPSSTALQAKYSGSAPTSGSIRINVVY